MAFLFIKVISKIDEEKEEKSQNVEEKEEEESSFIFKIDVDIFKNI